MKKMLILALKGYRKHISPYTIRSCRHVPSCSEYAVEAVERFGTIKGSARAIWRILRCNPFARGGYDPVVSATKEAETIDSREFIVDRNEKRPKEL